MYTWSITSNTQYGLFRSVIRLSQQWVDFCEIITIKGNFQSVINNRAINIVTRIPTARQRLRKPIPAEANARNNRMSIVRQRISKHTSLSTEAVFSTWSMQSDYKERFNWEELIVADAERVKLKKSSFERVVKNWVEFWRWQSEATEKKWKEIN
jgi:hypothetical protein